ncbi:hypothetical protein PT974_05659 [Cladobotryum mycophilum]|uniref:Uncharacterized protein n=1 Tax=Cladobotryum mycophilum TaxID=491253 RepID=A0ABR0SJC8_9HYPO
MRPIRITTTTYTYTTTEPHILGHSCPQTTTIASSHSSQSKSPNYLVLRMNARSLLGARITTRTTYYTL